VELRVRGRHDSGSNTGTSSEGSRKSATGWARDASVDRLQLSVGASFHHDQSPDFNAEGRRLPTLGWRNRLRKPPTGFGPLNLPDWVTVRDDSSHIELTLGPSAFDLDARDAAKVRDMVVESGLL